MYNFKNNGRVVRKESRYIVWRMDKIGIECKTV